jgi:exodeoxyribonuclease-3
MTRPTSYARGVHEALTDIFETRTLDGNALIQPESREAFVRQTIQGWTEALRKLYPEGTIWAFWDYKRDRFQADKGMRLDHVLLSPEMSTHLINGSVDRWVCCEENAGDHARVWIRLDF